MVSFSCGYFSSSLQKAKSVSGTTWAQSVPGVARPSHKSIPFIMSLWKLWICGDPGSKTNGWCLGLKTQICPRSVTEKAENWQTMSVSWDFYQWTLRAWVSSGAPGPAEPHSLMMKSAHTHLSTRNFCYFLTTSRSIHFFSLLPSILGRNVSRVLSVQMESYLIF